VGIPGSAAHATTPGKNGRIAFSADLGLGGEIYTIQRDGTGLHQLTELDGNAFHPDWSPDGTKIAFGLEDQIESDGSDLDLLTNFHRGTLGAFAGSYSPDGSRIVYRLQDPDNETFRLFKMHPDGSDRTLITRLPFSPRFIDWGSQRRRSAAKRLSSRG
jgi:Tol biopolymer transport system component